MTNRALSIIHNILTLLENDHESDAVDTSKWKRVGRQLGSNPGGTYKDETGKHWYIKQSKSPDHARNENLSNEFAKKLGVPVLDHRLITHNGKLGTASPIVKLDGFDHKNEKDRQEASKHFGAAAYLANHDHIGLDFDNQSRVNGKLHTLDFGGALKYRAMGTPKGHLFGDKVGEFDTMRNKDIAPQAAKVFGPMKPHEIVDSIRPVARLKNSEIHDLIQKHGPIDPGEKKELGDKMIARKKDLISRANTLASKHGLENVKDIDD